MELESLGHERLARRLVATNAEAADDPLVPALVPFHACPRAIVRGKVDGLAARDAAIPAAERDAARERGRRLFALAGRFAWRSGDPVVIACTGLSGTGKSAVAAMLGDTTGFRVVSSDVIRRENTPPGGVRYTADARAAVYARIREAVDVALTNRESLVVDATYLSRAERDRLAHTVACYGSRHVFVECEAREDVVRRRLDARDASSVSDARWDTYLAQRRTRDAFGEGEPVVRVETSGLPADTRAALLPRLWAWRQGRPAPSESPPA
jgi:predicted kinase